MARRKRKEHREVSMALSGLSNRRPNDRGRNSPREVSWHVRQQGHREGCSESVVELLQVSRRDKRGGAYPCCCEKVIQLVGNCKRKRASAQSKDIFCDSEQLMRTDGVERVRFQCAARFGEERRMMRKRRNAVVDLMFSCAPRRAVTLGELPSLLRGEQKRAVTRVGRDVTRVGRDHRMQQAIRGCVIWTTARESGMAIA